MSEPFDPDTIFNPKWREMVAQPLPDGAPAAEAGEEVVEVLRIFVGVKSGKTVLRSRPLFADPYNFGAMMGSSAETLARNYHRLLVLAHGATAPPLQQIVKRVANAVFSTLLGAESAEGLTFAVLDERELEEMKLATEPTAGSA